MHNQTLENKLASKAAYAGAFLFALLIVMFNTMPQNVVLISFVGVAFHVILFPVVAALPAPGWARAAGYGWLVLDIAVNVMQLNGVDEHLAPSIRLGGHVSTALWAGSVSLRSNSAMKIVGILFTVAIGGYSLNAPWVPIWGLYPSTLLFVFWLFFLGKMLSKL